MIQYERLPWFNGSLIFFEGDDVVILMCKDNEVYNFNTNEILNKNLLPIILQDTSLDDLEQEVYNWLKRRFYSEQLVYLKQHPSITGQAFRFGKIHEITNGFTLSDCYWLKYNDNVSWKQDNLYKVDNFNKNKFVGEHNSYVLYNDTTSRYTYWDSPEVLVKTTSPELEYECLLLCRQCGIKTVDVLHVTDTELHIKNCTDENTSLALLHSFCKSYDEMEEDNDEDIEDCIDEPLDIILWYMGAEGFKVILFDLIISNPDRHLGNIGYLVDSNTGERIGMAPIFDFDMVYIDRDVPKLQNQLTWLEDLIDNIKYKTNKDLYPEDAFKILISMLDTIEQNTDITDLLVRVLKIKEYFNTNSYYDKYSYIVEKEKRLGIFS